MISRVDVLPPGSFVILFRCGAVMCVCGMGIRTAVPVGVHDVVLGIAYIEFLGLFGVYLLDEYQPDNLGQSSNSVILTTFRLN